MKNKVLSLTIISVSAMAYIMFFQNCSSSTNFTSSVSNSVEPSNALPTEEPIVPVNSGSTSNFSLTHNNGHREFTIVITGISITDSQCRLQFFKNGTTWTDLSVDFPCNTDVGPIKFDLPAEDYWSNNFNANQGVQIRLVKASDRSLIGYFSQKLFCSVKPASAVSTPHVDENCNAQWDDTELGTKQYHYAQTAAKTMGSIYNCPPVSMTPDNKESVFEMHQWSYSTGLHEGSDCHYSTYMFGVSGPRQTRTSNTLTGTTPEHVYMTYGNQCTMGSGTKIENAIVVPVSGYAFHSAEWTTAACVYAYYPNAKYY